MSLLGYTAEPLETIARPIPIEAERRDMRESARALRPSRRRQLTPRPRALAAREARAAGAAA